MKVTIDARHADPRIGRVQAGDDVRLGTAIGATIEPDWLWARLVGILKRREGVGPYVLRKWTATAGTRPASTCAPRPLGWCPGTAPESLAPLLQAQAVRAEDAGFGIVVGEAS